MTVSTLLGSLLIGLTGEAADRCVFSVFHWQATIIGPVSLSESLLLDVLTMVFYGEAPTGSLYPSVALRPAEIMEKGGKHIVLL